MLRTLDLFSGIGGFSLGLERSGAFKTVAFCEIDPFCRRVLAKHWPDVPCHDDVTTREFQEGEADVICGGFPCQDISLAGDGAGIAGARSGLWRHLVRAIRLVRPRYALVENVAALLGRGMGTVLGDLAEIGADAEWHCIPASAVGAPHRRDRIWIVADTMPAERRPDIASRGRVARPVGLPSWKESPSGLGAGSEALANPNFNLGDERRADHTEEGPGRRNADRSSIGPHVADTGKPRLSPPQCETVLGTRWWHEGRAASECRWWAVEPDVGRVAHGVPARVDRLRSLGNAVVPQIPEMIGRAILNANGA